MPSNTTLLLLSLVLFLIWKCMKYVDFEAAFNAASSEELKVVGPAPPRFPGFVKVANRWFACYYREASPECRISVLHITVRGRVGTLTLVFNEPRHSLLEVHRDKKRLAIPLGESRDMWRAWAVFRNVEYAVNLHESQHELAPEGGVS